MAIEIIVANIFIVLNGLISSIGVHRTYGHK